MEVFDAERVAAWSASTDRLPTGARECVERRLGVASAAASDEKWPKRSRRLRLESWSNGIEGGAFRKHSGSALARCEEIGYNDAAGSVPRVEERRVGAGALKDQTGK